MHNELTDPHEMPSAVEIERLLLTAMANSPDATATASENGLEANDFYLKEHGILYNMIVGVWEENADYNGMIVLEESKKTKFTDNIEYNDKESWVRNFVVQFEPSGTAGAYCKKIKNAAALRKTIVAGREAINDCYSGKDASEIIGDLEKKILDLVNKTTGDNEDPIDKLNDEALAGIKEAKQNQGKITGIKTGFLDIDKLLRGLRKKRYIIIAGRPAMGKSALASNMIHHIAVKEKKTVAFFSLEMGSEDLLKRMYAADTRITHDKIEDGDLTDYELGLIEESAKEISSSNMIIMAKSGVPIDEIKAKCRKWKTERGLDVVFIDYLQNIKGIVGKRYNSRSEEVADVSKALQSLALNLDIPIVALAQLSRASETRSEKRPTLSDLRESGQIEQDADAVLMVYRDEYYNPTTTKTPGLAEIDFKKNRHGKVGTVYLNWESDYMSFKNSTYNKADDKYAASKKEMGGFVKATGDIPFD